MISVFLADDEPAILRGLLKLIDWEKLGLQIIGEACSGEELLSAVLHSKPEIVVTDISMPGMNGIDVLKRIKELELNTKVIFISAYRDFSYAKDALSFGAVDYLIKPIDREKLESLLKRTVAEIHAASQRIFSDSRLRLYEDRQRRQELLETLRKWVESSEETLPVQLQQELLNSGTDKLFTFCFAEIDRTQYGSGSWREGERKLLLFAMQNLAEELIREVADAWILAESDRLILLIRHASGVLVQPLAAHLQERFHTVLKVSVTISIGSASPLGQLRRCCNEAERGITMKFFVGTSSLIEPRHQRTGQEYNGQDCNSLEQQLLGDLYSRSPDAFGEKLELWLESVRMAAWGNHAYALQLVGSLLIRALRENASGVAEMNVDAASLAKRLQAQETFTQLAEVLRDDLFRIRACLHQGSSGKENEQIRQIKAYIDEHFKEVNLEMLATRFYMNQSYFSVFFKKHIGCNFKQYVTDLRMKVAVRLLLQTDCLLYEIAEQAGYQNARQFSETFKKYYGMLPNEYRQQTS